MSYRVRVHDDEGACVHYSELGSARNVIHALELALKGEYYVDGKRPTVTIALDGRGSIVAVYWSEKEARADLPRWEETREDIQFQKWEVGS